MKRRDLIKSASLAAIAPFLPSLTSGMSEIEENKI